MPDPKEHVPYETAVELFKKGFDGVWTYKVYDKDGNLIDSLRGNTVEGYILAPLYQQVIRWLRETHHIHVAVSSFPVYKDCYGIQYSRRGMSGGWQPENSSYENCLDKVILLGISLVN